MSLKERKITFQKTADDEYEIKIIGCDFYAKKETLSISDTTALLAFVYQQYGNLRPPKDGTRLVFNLILDEERGDKTAEQIIAEIDSENKKPAKEKRNFISRIIDHSRNPKK